MSANTFRRASVFALLTLAVASAQPQVPTFFSDVDDTDQPYALYLPKNYSPDRKYPLVLTLHGAGSNHRLNLRRVFGQSNLASETDAEATRYFPALRDVDFIVAAPLARGTMGYQGIPEKDVYDVLADVERRYPIDEDRVYLTGLSMGGGGALWIGLSRPDVWAAIAPVCPAPPAETFELAPNALNLPVHFFHGAADPVVNPGVSRMWVDKLRELGAHAEYIEYPNVKHNSWENAYKDGAIFDWFAKFKRNRFPDEVRFVTSRYARSSAYWVRIDRLTPGTLASLDAKFTGANRIEVTTAKLTAFTLALAGHPRFEPAKPLQIAIDGKLVKATAKSLSFSQTDGTWTATAAPPAPKRVVADRDVKPSDLERANLVLFGTRETNRVIAQLAPGLPLQLNAGAADYGLLYIWPQGNRYVLVNSGLPWWTGVERLPRREFRFLPPIPNVATVFGDYVLFKGSLENVLVNGRFTNNWKLPGQDAQRIQSTNAVELRDKLER